MTLLPMVSAWKEEKQSFSSVLSVSKGSSWAAVVANDWTDATDSFFLAIRIQSKGTMLDQKRTDF